MSIDYTQSQTSALTGYIFNYQPVRPRRVFRGELNEALASYLPRIHASGSKAWRSSLLAREPIIFREHPDFQCTFWHVETVMKKVAVVLRHSKKPCPQGKKEPAV